MATKRNIPCGYLCQCILTWDEKYNRQYKAFLSSENSEEANQASTDLMQCYNAKHKQRWGDTVQGIDFTHFKD